MVCFSSPCCRRSAFFVKGERTPRETAATFASTLRGEIALDGHQGSRTDAARARTATQEVGNQALTLFDGSPELTGGGDGVDVLEANTKNAQRALERESDLRGKVESDGIAWGTLQKFIHENAVPKQMDDGWQIAYQTVPKALDALYGPQNQGWHTFRRDGKAWIQKGPKS